MKKWGYCRVCVDPRIQALTKIMNELGEDGWELVGMLEVGTKADMKCFVILYFKRERK